MSELTDLEIVGWILSQLEGGGVGRAAAHDRGGFTQWGVTARAYADYHRVPVEAVTTAQLRAVTRADAEAIWLELFLRRTRFAEVADWRLRLLLCQWAGNAGAAACVRALQALLLVDVDGVVGPRTLAAIAGADPAWLRSRALAAQVLGWRRLMLRDPEQRENAPGWLKRLADVLDVSA